MVFAYMNQPTVIDVACSIEVVDEAPMPPHCGKPLELCEDELTNCQFE